jgi:hypothetical protein
MTEDARSLFLYLASYAPWHEATAYPERLFRCLEEAGFRPERYDDRDPPRRRFTGTEQDVPFWFAKRGRAGRWLQFQRQTHPHPYGMTVHWVDRNIEFYRTRGDYHNLYMWPAAEDAKAAVALWESLCRSLHPFHAFLDTDRNYNRRAHEVAPDGRITNKNTGWYLQRIPGLFAYNYFGTVYLRRWGAAVRNLPATLTTPDANGLFVAAPSGLDLEARMSEVYSPDDLAIIQALGPEWFHLPGQPDRVHAPTLEEFIAATPQPA